MGQTLLNSINQTIPFVMSNVISTLVTAFFTVVGGAIPIAILIYLFSRKEKRLLVAHAETIESSLPLQEKLFEELVEMNSRSFSLDNLEQNIEQFKQLVEVQNMIEENKKLIKYARNYNFILAVGHVLRMSNYMPRNISEHKEISRTLPR
jgi:hypothetical protein